MEVRRDRYLNNLIDRMHNGMIKVITGVRRCAKHICCSNSSETTSETS